LLSDEDVTAIEHMLAAIQSIEEFVAGMDFAGYQQDGKTRSAVERQLEIMSEASRRLEPDTFERLLGEDGPAVRAIGNVLRHEYQHVSDKVIWDTVERDLPGLRVRLEQGPR
jgi:uncharacterized protein with HEPN domain